MRYRFYTLDVFSKTVFGGNPLAVFPDAEGLSGTQMQQVAKEFNLSETIFVFNPTLENTDFKVRIFTPSSELPFAGHPTVGVAHLLASLGRIRMKGDESRIVLEEGVGAVPVLIRSENGKPQFVQFSAAKMPVFPNPVPSSSDIAASLSLDNSDLMTGKYQQKVVDCGVTFLIVPLRSLAVIEKIRIDSSHWKRTMKDLSAVGMYVFTTETAQQSSNIHARMFAPDEGILEDPATGSAATALAGYLADLVNVDGPLHWVLEQGFEMGRPSIIDVEADRKSGKTVAIRVGGNSVIVSEGTIDLPQI
ncbi:MAG: PhzF family phenazine biosynthesis protein [SAR324 cluster bacterium]|nr:PhzF family phenazine biosynthesis protein [SAR324 cluster bacterium]